MSSLPSRIARAVSTLVTVVLCLTVSTICGWFLLWCAVTRGFYRNQIPPGAPVLRLVAPVERVLRSTPTTDRWRQNFVRNQLPRVKYHPWTEQHLEAERRVKFWQPDGALSVRP